MYDQDLVTRYCGRDICRVTGVLADPLARRGPGRGTHCLLDLQLGDRDCIAEVIKGACERAGRHERVTYGQDAQRFGLGHG
jgi:hypothetical protein